LAAKKSIESKKKKVRSNYPEEVDAWEEKYGEAWDANYEKCGNIWSTDGQATKRTFDDTLGKTRSETKKPKVSVTEVDSDEDAEMLDASDPFTAQPPLLRCG
jgi:hypothetical protein